MARLNEFTGKWEFQCPVCDDFSDLGLNDDDDDDDDNDDNDDD